MIHAASLARSARLQRVHAVLADGHEHSTRAIVRAAHVCAVNSCVAELRAHGAEIACRHDRDPETGARIFVYRLLRQPHRPAPRPSRAGT